MCHTIINIRSNHPCIVNELGGMDGCGHFCTLLISYIRRVLYKYKDKNYEFQKAKIFGIFLGSRIIYG